MYAFKHRRFFQKKKRYSNIFLYINDKKIGNASPFLSKKKKYKRWKKNKIKRLKLRNWRNLFF